MIAYIILGIVIFVLGTYISQFNKLKRTRNQVENAKSSLDALFIKRNELIPNLVAVLEKYTDFEKEVFEKITALRQSVAGNPKDYQAEGETDKLLKQLMVQVENYPQLKASQQFTTLQFSLNECEEQIAAGRRYLSASITYYNNAVTTFPGNIVAGMTGMQVHEWERATEAQREKVDVKDMFAK
ncbi:MAG: LemA family protein [Candidatus Azobacteroides sp.]|nr:LemA family protein [Candidatus Azobacteroides sp.]